MDLIIKILRDEAEKRIQQQITEGKSIYDSIDMGEDPNNEEVRNWYNVSQEISVWDDYNYHLLVHTFNSTEIANEYITCGARIDKYHFFYPFGERLAKLKSILRRLILIPDSTNIIVEAPKTEKVIGKDIFIVHGRDLSVKQNVARFIEQCRLNPIILDEIPNKGKTIIEKFEDCIENIGYAIALLTPDDIGGLVAKSEQELRARQNVIFELGYFVGNLGRGRVCILYKDELELPTDLSGMVYTRYDNHEGWKLKLAKEIKASGIDIDMNLV